MGTAQKTVQIEETSLSYSRSFFESPRLTVDFSDNKGTFGEGLGVILNELAHIIGGYYVLAILFMPITLVLTVFVFFPEHYMRCTSLNNKGRYRIRYRIMRMVAALFDQSATQQFLTIFFGCCAGAEMRNRCTHLCSIKGTPYVVFRIVMILVMVAIRFFMACTALFFLPISVMVYPCYFIIIFVLRRMLFKGRGQYKENEVPKGPYFVGQREKSAWNPVFPWDLRGAGHGYLEFADSEEGADDSDIFDDSSLSDDVSKSDQIQPSAPPGSRYKERAASKKEMQGLLESSSKKSTRNEFNV